MKMVLLIALCFFLAAIAAYFLPDRPEPLLSLPMQKLLTTLAFACVGGVLVALLFLRT